MRNMDLPSTRTNGSSEERCDGLTEEVRVLSLFSHDDEAEDDYFFVREESGSRRTVTIVNIRHRLRAESTGTQDD